MLNTGMAIVIAILVALAIVLLVTVIPDRYYNSKVRRSRRLAERRLMASDNVTRLSPPSTVYAAYFTADLDASGALEYVTISSARNGYVVRLTRIEFERAIEAYNAANSLVFGSIEALIARLTELSKKYPGRLSIIKVYQTTSYPASRWAADVAYSGYYAPNGYNTIYDSESLQKVISALESRRY